MSLKKYELVKRILIHDKRYDADYLMCWRYKDLNSFYNQMMIKLKKNKESEIDLCLTNITIKK